LDIFKKKATDLKELPFQYKDFQRWQRQFLDSAEGLRHRRYWLNKLKGFDPGFTDEQIRTKHGVAGEAKTGIDMVRKIDGKLYEDLNQFAIEQNLTVNTLLLGCFTLLLNKVFNRNDITVGAATLGRHFEYIKNVDTSELLGCFANIMFIRNIINKDQPVTDYLQSVQKSFLDDLNFGAYPFAKLVEELPGFEIRDNFWETLYFFNYMKYDFLKSSESNMEEFDKMLGEKDMYNKSSGLEVIEFKNSLILRFSFYHIAFDNSLREEIKDMYLSILKKVVYRRVPAMSHNI
jgi:hypothetical protein